MLFLFLLTFNKTYLSIIGKSSTDSKKTSQWEVFFGKCMSFVCQGSFSLTKPPLFHSNIWIEKFTRKGALTI